MISTSRILRYWNRKNIHTYKDMRLEIYLMIKFLSSKDNTFWLTINRKQNTKHRICYDAICGIETIWQLRKSFASEEDHRLLYTVIFDNVLYVTHCICSLFHVLQIFTEFPLQIVGLRLRSLPGHLPWMGAGFCQRPLMRWSSFILFICKISHINFIHWTIPEFLEWILLYHGGWYFSSCIELTLQACLHLPA